MSRWPNLNDPFKDMPKASDKIISKPLIYRERFDVTTDAWKQLTETIESNLKRGAIYRDLSGNTLTSADAVVDYFKRFGLISTQLEPVIRVEPANDATRPATTNAQNERALRAAYCRALDYALQVRDRSIEAWAMRTGRKPSECVVDIWGKAVGQLYMKARGMDEPPHPRAGQIDE